MVQICPDWDSRTCSFIFRIKNLKVHFIRSIRKDNIAISKETASVKLLYYNTTLEEFMPQYMDFTYI